MSELKVNKISPSTGTAFTVGDSGDTFTVPSGATLTTTNATLNLPTTITATTEVKTDKLSPASGTSFTLGDSGDTFTVPSGATITNSGTASGFGGGAVQQVVQVYKTDVMTYTGAGAITYADITGMSVAITPILASSKLLINWTACVGAIIESGTKLQADIEGGGYTDIGMPDSGGNRFPSWTGNASNQSSSSAWTRSMGNCFLWTPSYTLTDVITVKGLLSATSANAIAFNRSQSSADTAVQTVATSGITIWELNF